MALTVKLHEAFTSFLVIVLMILQNWAPILFPPWSPVQEGSGEPEPLVLSG